MVQQLNIIKVPAPLFLEYGTGLQDTLFKIDCKIKFKNQEVLGEHRVFETIHSLAKWKRHCISQHKFPLYHGIFVDGHYIRAHEPILDKTHTLSIRQLDWEIVIKNEDRNLEFLKDIVTKIFQAIK